MPEPLVTIGGIPIGPEHPTVLMAEIGTFFNQDVEQGCAYLRAAVTAGVTLLKGEILHDPDVCLRQANLAYTFHHAGGSHTEDYRALIERKVIPLDGYRKIISVTRELGAPFVASIYDFAGVDLMVEMGGAALKIARHNIDHLPLIAYAARTGLPMIFDAGGVYLDEVVRAVRHAQAHGAGGVIVNHHPGANPAPAKVHHLRMIETYRTALGIPIGFTCHYRGEEMMHVAVGLGASLIEKGVVDDPDRVEQDLVSALRLDQIRPALARLQACWEALGSSQATPVEPRNLSVRKGWVARRPIAAGEALTLENTSFAWPPIGIPVHLWDDLSSRARSRRPLAPGEPIQWPDVEFA